MYLVSGPELENGVTVPYALVGEGSGSAIVNPLAAGIQVSDSSTPGSGVPQVGDQVQLTTGFSGLDSENFKYEGVYTDAFGDAGFIVTGANGNSYFITNNPFPGGSPESSSDALANQLFSDSGANPPAPEVPESGPCFLEGTRILGSAGELYVEAIKAGDLVLTWDQRLVPVRWVGRSTVSRRFADPLRVLPIRVKACALGENVPKRDLLVSPDHALYIDGVLIHAGALVNGTSIVRESNIPLTFTYYHVEIDDHSLILAENTLAETFVDNIDRMAFNNWSEYQALYPERKAIVEMSYPRAKAHRQVPQAIRLRLADRGLALYGESASSAA
jgi:Hint domain